MSDVTPELNNTEKYIRANLVKKIVTQLIEWEIKHKGRVPCGEGNKHLDDAKFVYTAISHNIINRAMTIKLTSY